MSVLDPVQYIAVFSYISGFNIFYLLLAIASYYFSVLIYAVRWKLVLESLGYRVSLRSLSGAILSSIFVNNITPTARSGGEFLRVAWLSKKHKIPLVLSTASVVYERIMEALPILLLTLITALYIIAYPVIHITITVIVALLWFFWDRIVDIIDRLTKNKLREKDVLILKSLKNNTALNIIVFLLSASVWALDIIRLKLITMAIGLDVSIWILVAVSLINFVLGVVAFTPGGLGIVEGGLVGTLMLLGVPTTIAVWVALLERFISFVLSSFTGFLALVLAGGLELWKALRSH